MIDVCQYYGYIFDSECGRVLNIPGLHMILNKFLHIRYLPGFWILVLTQGSIENSPSYSSESQYARPWIYKGCEYVKVTQGSL